MKSSIKFLVWLSWSLYWLLSASGSMVAKEQQGWTSPLKLSTSGNVGDYSMTSDAYGYVHVFWIEHLNKENVNVIQYARFDGKAWTLPVDILFAPARARISATVDLEGILHLLFTNRDNGAIYYTEASIQNATSVQEWQKPKQLDISADWMDLKVDSNGVFHLLYSKYGQDKPGVYYANSADDGIKWSKSIWLDPDIPPGMTPSEVQLDLGEGNSLHAAWFYMDQDFLGRWIRYTHSFDQGQTWAVPFTIDEVASGSDELRLPSPSLAVNGKNVHLIWAGDFQTHRKHRVSHDSGQTWNQAEFVFGDLLGQAIGDGLAFDALGRLHFFGQIRWPQGIYHAYWSQGRWSSPSMIYLIAQDAFEPIGDRIHAHRVRTAIRAGNQLVVTFTTAPSDPESILYVMYMTLPDVPVLNILPLPEQTPAPTLGTELVLASPTPLPVTPTKTPYLDINFDPSSSRIYTPSSWLIWGILPVALLVTSVIIIRFLQRRNG